MAKAKEGETKEEMVLRRQRGKSPLKFGDREVTIYKNEFKPLTADRSKYTVEQIVKFVLKAASERSSTYKNGREQCRVGARRTAGDIWRHCLLYKPEITLFQVMRCLHRLTHDRVYITSYCSTINRRTFRLPRTENDNTMGTNIYDATHRDEFGLIFSEWARIGGKE